jgi:hypothetical protein
VDECAIDHVLVERGETRVDRCLHDLLRLFVEHLGDHRDRHVQDVQSFQMTDDQMTDDQTYSVDADRSCDLLINISTQNYFNFVI